MARRGFSDIDAEVLLRLGNRSDITATQRGFFIKDAYLNVAMMFRHKEIEQVSANENLTINTDTLVPVVTDIWFPTTIRNTTNGFILSPDSLERVERLQVKPTAPPYKFYWYGGSFVFDSLADTAKVIKIWYKRKPVDFSGSTHSELDELFDPLIIMEAARIGFETVRDYAEAKEQKGLFAAEVQNKKIPVNESMLNDYRQGFKVRFR